MNSWPEILLEGGRPEKHVAMLSLYFLYYFFRINKTLRVTPAMEAGLSDTVRDC